MSDTPETNAAAADGIDCYGNPLKAWDYKASKDGEVVTAEFARRIERERDEAREALEHVKEYGTEEINAAVELRQKLAQTLIERDEAIRLLKLCADYTITTYQEKAEEFLKQQEEAK